MIIKHFTRPYQNIVNQIRTESYISFNNKRMQAISLWDTGASCTCISEDVIKQLSLMSISKIPILTPSSKIPEFRDIYIVDVELPNGVNLKSIPVCSSEIGNQGIQMLIGMDIITKGDFAISNYNNRTIFSFRYPAYEDINFVNDARKKDLMKILSHGKGKRKK